MVLKKCLFLDEIHLSCGQELHGSRRDNISEQIFAAINCIVVWWLFFIDPSVLPKYLQHHFWISLPSFYNIIVFYKKCMVFCLARSCNCCAVRDMSFIPSSFRSSKIIAFVFFFFVFLPVLWSLYCLSLFPPVRDDTDLGQLICIVSIERREVKIVQHYEISGKFRRGFLLTSPSESDG